jgi:hypothetical protein
MGSYMGLSRIGSLPPLVDDIVRQLEAVLELDERRKKHLHDKLQVAGNSPLADVQDEITCWADLAACCSWRG